MKKSSALNPTANRREFLRDMAVAGGVAFLSTSPTRAFGQAERRIPPVSITYYTTLPEQEDIWKLVTQDWKKLGLDIKLNVLATPVALHRMYTDRDYGHIGSVSWASDMTRLDPNFHLGEQLHSDGVRTGGRNYGFYHSAEFDKYCDLQRREMDRDKRREYVWKAQEAAAADYPIWWMYYSANIEAYNSRDWENVQPMPIGGLGSFYNLWTYLQIRPKTARKRIRVAYGSEIYNLNPFSGHNAPSIAAMRWVYDTYARIGPNLDAVPWAAESWNIVGPKTMDITLRAGMKFHDGKPVTVQDVKFTWDYTQKWKFPLYNWINKHVEKTDILNDRAVRFHLTEPHAPFIDQILTTALILPKHIWEKIPESAGLKNPIDWPNAAPIGSGPFKLKESAVGVKLESVRNDKYWKPGLPHVDGVIVHGIVLGTPAIRPPTGCAVHRPGRFSWIN
ncbi:MAG: ABC transporter substrate-binding protein [Chloroflexota bacterium]